MTLAKVNVTVSVEAKDVLIDFQVTHGYDNLDSALDALLSGYAENAPKMEGGQ